jgi:hypothetical protein
MPSSALHEIKPLVLKGFNFGIEFLLYQLEVVGLATFNMPPLSPSNPHGNVGCVEY